MLISIGEGEDMSPCSPLDGRDTLFAIHAGHDIAAVLHRCRLGIRKCGEVKTEYRVQKMSGGMCMFCMIESMSELCLSTVQTTSIYAHISTCTRDVESTARRTSLILRVEIDSSVDDLVWGRPSVC